MKYIEVLTSALRDKFDNDTRTGVHVSDLTMCPRKAVWRKLNPEPCTMRDLNFFTSGRSIHDTIQTLANHDSKKFEIEKSVEWEGISGHIDLVDTENNIPIECKSARMKEMNVVKPHYVEQLKAYMAILGSKTGTILVQLLMHFDDKPFVEFEVTMDDSEIAETKQKLLLKKELYLEALSKKDPMIASGIVNDSSLNWLCKSCNHFAECLKAEEKDV